MEKLLTIKDLTERLPISKNNAYELMRRNDFPSIRLGRKYIVLEDELEKYLKSNIGNKIVFNN